MNQNLHQYFTRKRKYALSFNSNKCGLLLYVMTALSGNDMAELEPTDLLVPADMDRISRFDKTIQLSLLLVLSPIF